MTSKRVPIFLGTHEANYKMVPICGVPISRLRTVEVGHTDKVGRTKAREFLFF